MFRYQDLTVPIVGAPMAGGPSTPALVTAVSGTGAIGFLAAGYLTPERLATDIEAVRATGTLRFGVNLFVPEHGRAADIDEINRYRNELVEYATGLGVELPTEDVLGVDDDDHWQDKLDIVGAKQVPVVSFTFGCPDAATITRLHELGSAVTVTVTTPEDARAAVRAGADSLVVQGPDAGGHRSTFSVDTEPTDVPLVDLLDSVADAVDVPLVAAGGISSSADVRRVLEHGAVAAQIGSLLLRTPEAGTKPAHADALGDARFSETVVTRAFSGRPARALRNRFTDRFHDSAASQYPAVNTLTGALRKAAAEDPDGLNLWAGTGYRRATTDPAAAVVEQLTASL